MLTIRLRRMGKKDRAFYRFVVSDSRKTPTASAVEEVGHYDPIHEPPLVRVDRERVDYWLDRGATLSTTVKSLLRRAGTADVAVAAPAKPKAKTPAETEPPRETVGEVEAAAVEIAAETPASAGSEAADSPASESAETTENA